MLPLKKSSPDLSQRSERRRAAEGRPSTRSERPAEGRPKAGRERSASEAFYRLAPKKMSRIRITHKKNMSPVPKCVRSKSARQIYDLERQNTTEKEY